MGPFPASAKGQGAGLAQCQPKTENRPPQPGPAHEPKSPQGGIKGCPVRGTLIPPLLLSPARATLSFRLAAHDVMLVVAAGYIYLHRLAGLRPPLHGWICCRFSFFLVLSPAGVG
jgi:hypothetical protein